MRSSKFAHLLMENQLKIGFDLVCYYLWFSFGRQWMKQLKWQWMKCVLSFHIEWSKWWRQWMKMAMNKVFWVRIELRNMNQKQWTKDFWWICFEFALNEETWIKEQWTGTMNEMCFEFALNEEHDDAFLFPHFEMKRVDL